MKARYGKNSTLLEFTVNGYEYRISQDFQDDCIKNTHLAYFGNEQLDIPALDRVSPYDYLTVEQFYEIILDAQYEDAQAQLEVGCEFD